MTKGVLTVKMTLVFSTNHIIDAARAGATFQVLSLVVFGISIATEIVQLALLKQLVPIIIAETRNRLLPTMLFFSHNPASDVVTLGSLA